MKQIKLIIAAACVRMVEARVNSGKITVDKGIEILKRIKTGLKRVSDCLSLV